MIYQTVYVHMTEYAVHHKMEIVPHYPFFFRVIALKYLTGFVIELLSVGAYGNYRIASVRHFQRPWLQLKFVQRRVQKAQIYQQRVPGQQQHLPR